SRVRRERTAGRRPGRSRRCRRGVRVRHRPSGIGNRRSFGARGARAASRADRLRGGGRGRCQGRRSGASLPRLPGFLARTAGVPRGGLCGPEGPGGTVILSALWLSIVVATIATSVAVATGTLAGWGLARRPFVGRELVDALLSLPLVLPPTVTGY